mmetsp:Transcript_53769/g.144827  ORF Transcript_53769/g.144827 Transcript_53769/m.144827 type:complete len:214 (-) Transcript_53769:245-886(-)
MRSRGKQLDVEGLLPEGDLEVHDRTARGKVEVVLRGRSAASANAILVCVRLPEPPGGAGKDAFVVEAVDSAVPRAREEHAVGLLGQVHTVAAPTAPCGCRALGAGLVERRWGSLDGNLAPNPRVEHRPGPRARQEVDPLARAVVAHATAMRQLGCACRSLQHHRRRPVKRGLVLPADKVLAVRVLQVWWRNPEDLVGQPEVHSLRTHHPRKRV